MNDMTSELLSAIEQEDIDTIKYIFSKNDSFENARINDEGDTPIIYAARVNSNEVVDYLSSLSEVDLIKPNYLDELYTDFIDETVIKESKIIIFESESEMDRIFIEKAIEEGRLANKNY